MPGRLILLAACLLAAVVAFFAVVWLLARPVSPVSPLVEFEPCYEIVVGQEWACSDGHAWLRQDGLWQDLGGLTPLPQVPRG